MPLGRWKKDVVLKTAAHGGSPPLPPHTTLASIESLAVPRVQEVVFLADFRCSGCQRRVAEIMSKMSGETQSVVISVLEKKVTVTCTYLNADKLTERQVGFLNQCSWSKGSQILRLFGCS